MLLDIEHRKEMPVDLLVDQAEDIEQQQSVKPTGSFTQWFLSVPSVHLYQ